MARQYLIPGWGYINETTTKDYLIPGWGYINESQIPSPVNLTPPVISGDPTVGSILTATNGTWANSPTSFTYQWQSNGVNIPGATSSTYITQISDIGHTVTIIVTAINSNGSASASSNGIIVISGLTQTFQPGSKGRKTDPHIYEKFPDFEPQDHHEIEYLLLTL